MYRCHFKRILDIIISFVAILTLSPLLIILSVLIRLKLGSPVLFKQERPGLNEKIFTLYKFRTMTNQKNEAGDLLPDDLRLTRFGRCVRSTSLDELPELFNVMKGDMSLIGPRPLLIRYIPYYRIEERKRSNVRPGITGLAQINGRNALSWEERFRLDVEYVNKLSFRLDMIIMFKTIMVVIKRKDILVGSELKIDYMDLERSNETAQLNEEDNNKEIKELKR